MTPALPVLMMQGAPSPVIQLDSLYDYLVAGGPIMWPLGLCSVIALAFAVERWLRLRRARLGTRRFGESIVSALKSGGAKQALETCGSRSTTMSRVLGAGLERAGSGVEAVEKAVEDAGDREVRRLTTSLRPFSVLSALAPLLGLLGTVIGILISFTNIALKSGMGKPELLAAGIAHALICTAAGLSIAIASQVFYYWYKSKIDSFVRDVEDLYADVDTYLRSLGSGATQGATA